MRFFTSRAGWHGCVRAIRGLISGEDWMQIRLVWKPFKPTYVLLPLTVGDHSSDRLPVSSVSAPRWLVVRLPKYVTVCGRQEIERLLQDSRGSEFIFAQNVKPVVRDSPHTRSRTISSSDHSQVLTVE